MTAQCEDMPSIICTDAHPCMASRMLHAWPNTRDAPRPDACLAGFPQADRDPSHELCAGAGRRQAVQQPRA